MKTLDKVTISSRFSSRPVRRNPLPAGPNWGNIWGNKLRPDPRDKADFTLSDPCCGTGGFLVSAYEWLMANSGGGAKLDRDVNKRVKKKTYFGQELVARPRRMALMNMYLHGVEPAIELGDSIYEPDKRLRFDVILTNPPFGTKGANQSPEREDFTISTSNKQLNFLQHIMTILKPGGRAAVVLPDKKANDTKKALKDPLLR